MKKTYSELIKLSTFEERFLYLKLKGRPGDRTFGGDRWVNQLLYGSPKWKQARHKAIIRDGACDLAILDREILSLIIVHHINPLSIEDLRSGSPKIYALENLVCVTKRTHNAIHFGDESLLVKSVVVERRPFDTCPWK